MRDEVLLIVHNYGLKHNRVRMELDAIADAGMQADVICLRDEGEPARDTYRTARIRRLPVRRHRGARLPTYIVEYLSFFLMAMVLGAVLFVRRRHRVVIAHSLPDVLVFAALVPRLFGSRVVLNLREFTPELVQTRYGVSTRHPLVRVTAFLERASCAFAHVVITVHDTGADLLAGRGVAREKLLVITNSIDMPARPPAGARGEAEELTLLYHGTAGNEYDLESVVEAVAESRGRVAVRLRIVGDGPALPAVAARARELGVTDAVAFEAPVPFARVPDLLREADAGVPILRETPYAHLGIPTKLLECVAAGIPVITVPGRAIRRYFGDDSLIYVPFGDARAIASAIEAIAHDRTGSAERVRRAQAELAQIDEAEMRSRYARLLSHLRAGGRRARADAVARAPVRADA